MGFVLDLNSWACGAAIAQWLERLSSKQEVMSSILIGGFFFFCYFCFQNGPESVAALPHILVSVGLL